MKKDEQNNQQDLQDYKPQQKKARKNKAQVSKASKASSMTRKRQQPDSSDQYLMPGNIPQTTYRQLIVSEGFENQLTKIVIRVPHSILQEQKFQKVCQTCLQTIRVVFSIEKQLENLTVLAKLPQVDIKMQVENQDKLKEPRSSEDKQKVQENSPPQIEEYVSVINIWGKYVYLMGYEPQNKNIKKIRKQINNLEYGEVAKFKLKQAYSDLFIYFNLRLEDCVTYEFNGLINQGNTCYMNSYLQTFYHLPAFRNLVYEAQIQDQNKFPATLQELFFNLSTSEKSVSPQSLIKSFGWGRRETDVQQDLQEFSCLFFQALQRKLNDSAPKMGYKNRTIQGLFKGSLNHYLRCVNVGTVIDYADFRRQNYEEFIDLQVPIAPTLSQALDQYTTEVHLEAENAYKTEEHGLQQAYKGILSVKKGVKIAYLPPILMIQLKRFQYDMIQNKNIKILAALQYDEELDFSKWSTSSDQEIYELYAVMVHEGSRAESGHYYNYAKVNNQWFKFNDEIVQKVQRDKVFKYNFGGFHQTVDFDSKEMKVNKKMIESKTTAYMLLYVKRSLKQELMQDQGKLPKWIENKNKNKIQMEEQKKKKKNFFHDVAFIDWDNNLKWSTCSDNGFLNDYILVNAKKAIPPIPKEANLYEWLVSEKIIQPQVEKAEQKKKKSKKNKIALNQSAEYKEPGIYLFLVKDQQILTGFIHKASHKTQDLLKLSPDPVIFKAPFQAKKDEYLCVVKKYKLDKQDGKIVHQFFYETVIPVKKQISYSELMSQLTQKFVKEPLASLSNSSDNLNKLRQYNFYIDDLKQGAINISQKSGYIPLSTPKSNQLLVIVVQEITFEMSADEAISQSFPNYYQIKKNMIELTTTEEKGPTIFKINISGAQNLSGLRRQIFQNLSAQKKTEYVSFQNIVLKAKIKKNAKIYSEVSQPDFKTVKDITKIDERVEFTFSALTVQSRLSQFIMQIYYRNTNKQLSDPISLVFKKGDDSQTLVKGIKLNPVILEFLQQDGFSPDQAEIILLNKTKRVINYIVNGEGKVISKGEFNTLIQKQKTLMIVVQGKLVKEMSKEPNIAIQDPEIEPMVSFLLYHACANGQRIGNPISFRVDRRMSLSELRAIILDLIKDQTLYWEEKIFICDPTKLKILVYANNKKAIELADQTQEQKKKFLIQQNCTNNDTKHKKSKDTKNQLNKQSNFEQIKKARLEVVVQLVQEQVSGIKQKQKIDRDKKQSKQKSASQDNAVYVFDDGGEKQEKQKESQEQKEQNQQGEAQATQNPEITQVEGPQTILGVFPRPKVLRIQILHYDLKKPEAQMKFYLD